MHPRGMAVADKRLPVNERRRVFRPADASYRKRTGMKQIIFAIMMIPIFMTIKQTAMSQDSRQKPQDSALLNTHWTLVSIGDTAIPKTAREAYIVFDEAKQAAYGSSGCNRMTGQFSLEGGRVKIGPMAGTRMACDPASMQLENTFYKALGEADGYVIEGNILMLKKGDAVLATFLKS